MKPIINPKELADIEKSFVDSMPDYTKFNNGADLLNSLGDEGMKWGTAFCQYTKKVFDIDLDLMYVVGWFCNSIEHSNDVRRWRKEKEVGPFDATEKSDIKAPSMTGGSAS